MTSPSGYRAHTKEKDQYLSGLQTWEAEAEFPKMAPRTGIPPVPAESIL